MSDSFTAESKGSFSLDRLQEDERQLDEKASLVDSQTDIDYKETCRIIGRCMLLLRYCWQRFSVVLSMEWVMTAVGTAVAPWAAKVIIDQVVLGQPFPEDGEGYPVFLKPVIAFLYGSSSISILLWLLLWTVVGVLIRVVWGYVHDLVEARMHHSILHMVRSRLFENVQGLAMTKLDNQPIGDTVFRTMHDVGALPSVLRMVIQITGWALVTFIAALLTMLSAYPDSPMAVLLAVASMPAFLIVTVPFSRMIRRRTQAQVAAGTVFVSTTEEGMDNIQAVQSLGANSAEKERFGLASANAFRRERYLALANTAVLRFGELAGKFLYWAFLLYVLGKVVSGELTAGDYAVVLGYFMAMSNPAHSLASLWIDLQTPTAQARRVFAMMDLEQEKQIGSVPIDGVSQGVVFDGVSFSYPDGRQALRQVSFVANIGEIVSLAGPTGAGKTTLAYLIPRYHSADEGRVLIDGRNVSELAIKDLRSQITYVFQETETMAISIADNIRLGKPGATLDEIQDVAKLVGMHEFISELPDRYDTVLGTTSSKLSVGQKQRISIARGLLRDTPILILDEPTSALDPESQEQLMHALRSISKERLILIVAHRLSTIQQSDRILFLEEGEVTEQGTHDQLMNIDSGRYRRFVELQNTEAVG